MTDLIGQTLGSYQVEALLGQGGMGAVYRVLHLSLRQPRALKVLSPGLAAEASFVERFQREAKIAAGLRHPNIVMIYDVGERDGLHYIVMELVEGQPLSDLLREGGPLPLARVVRLLEQLASALDYAHGRGVAHRDVKPANVLVRPDDTLTLVDFGIARAAEQSRLTRVGAVVGTPDYLAPEALLEGTTEPSADLYALGVLAYQLLVGRTPFSGSTPVEIARAQIHDPPPTPRLLNPSLSPRVEQVLLRQLAKQPAERYPTARGFVAALAEGLVEAAAPAEDVSSTVRLDLPAWAAPAASGPPAPPEAHAWPAAAAGGPPGPSAEPAWPPPAAAAGGRPASPAEPPTSPPTGSVGPGRTGRPRAALVGLAGLLLVGAALGLYLARRPAEPAGAYPTAAPTVAARPTSAPTAAGQAGPPTAAGKPAGAAATAAKPAAGAPASAGSQPTAPPPTAAVPAGSPAAAAPTAFRTVLQERFDNNQRGWTNNPDQTAWLGQGVYRLFGRVPIGAVAVGAPLAEPLRDVEVQASFRKVGGPPGGGYGLIVRDEGPGPRDGVNQGGRYYVLEVGDLGEYGIWRRDQDHWVDLIPWTKHSALRPGGEPQVLTVRALGPSLTLIVNGTQIATVQDTTLREGGVGFYSGGDLNEVSVDDFIVRVPS
jgi:serine/threonine-protein kinase